MLFNSFVFLVFAALFFLLWRLCPKKQSLRWLLLTVASFVFYGWWDWRFLFLLVINGLIDYFAGLWIVEYPNRKKIFLTLSMAGNLGTLCAFKYLGFITSNLNALFHMASPDLSFPVLTLPLVVGISFYTFQSMSYTIDVYRGELTPTKNVLHFFAYLSMFPQLVAGPIIRAAHLLPQLTEERRVSEEDKWDGTRLIVHGYFKKVVIADNLAPFVNSVFERADTLTSMPYWWLAVTMFAFQIYCDFSGYSDIARGLARWMGYDFPINFNHPYISSSLKEFWQRWHISLSTWFRDYVYIPLGGSRTGGNEQKQTGFWSATSNMWITMLVSGIWHGASWNFAIWGAVHALYLTIERLTGWPKHLMKLPGGQFLATMLVVMQVWVAWVFFRAADLSTAMTVLGHMFDFTHMDFTPFLAVKKKMLIFLLIGVFREVYHYYGLENSKFMQSKPMRALEPVMIAGMIFACVFFRGVGNAFIYFQF